MTKLTVGVTGPSGFVAGHLIRTFSARDDVVVLPCPRETLNDRQQLANFLAQCNVLVHLAGMNRGVDEEVYATNVVLAEAIVAAGQSAANLHIVFASSTQRTQASSYGRSKLAAERLFETWAQEGLGRSVTNLVIPNVFGPGCRPNYNSVVATFCHQLASGQQPRVLRDNEVEFIWINDLVSKIIEAAAEEPRVTCRTRHLVGSAKVLVSDLLNKLQSFQASHAQHDMVPDITDRFDANLYATYLSYLNLEQHCHRPQVHRDERGQLFEIIRMASGGQVFFSTTKPGVIRGNHFHTRKIEWFCVLKGEAVIRLRRIGDSEVHQFRVSGDSPEFISIPVLHTHQIENVGDEELLTMFWCNEIFVPEDADTYFEKVA